MEIRLKRYYGDNHVTKSRMEVVMEGETAPRLVCEAREPRFKEYTEVFEGAAKYCLPVGKWQLRVGGSPYSPMGLRVAKCPGHRQVYIGHNWMRQWEVGRVLIGYPTEAELPEEVEIENGEECCRELEKLVYEAFGNGEEMWLEIENIAVATTI
jgi:hypothetical protein